MPQGKLKTKVKVPKASQKKATQKRAKGPKKGGRVIKPKKTKAVQASKLKKDLQVSINKRIEKEIVLQAGKNSKLALVKSLAEESGGVSKKD